MAETRKLYPSVMFAALMVGGYSVAYAADDAAKAGVDPQADALLKSMSDYVGGLKSFSADVHVIDQQLLADAFKLSLHRQGAIKVQRPNKFYLTRQGLAINMEAFFNGKELVFNGKNIGAYVTVPVEGDIDAALDAGTKALGGELPARDLVSTDSYTPLMEPVEKGVYIGKVAMGDVVCHQLAFRTDDVDWQLWIQDGETPLPCRYSITSKWMAGSPEYIVSFSNWTVDSDLPASTFEFSAPAGAKALSADEFKAAAAAE